MQNFSGQIFIIFCIIVYGGQESFTKTQRDPRLQCTIVLETSFITVSSSLLSAHGLHYACVVTLEASTAMHLGSPQSLAADFLTRSVLCVVQACGVHYLHHLTDSLCLPPVNLLFHVVHVFFLTLFPSFNGAYFPAVFCKRVCGG